MRRTPTVAVLGGTFDRIHPGHLALLDAAFANADEVAIGLTTAGFLARHPKPFGARLRPYTVRRRVLAATVRARYPGRAFRIIPLEDPLGGSTAEGLDVLVVSEETRAGARAVNAARRRLHRAPLRVVVIPRILGEDLRPIAGRRIREGAINAEGRRSGPMRAVVWAPDRALAARAIAHLSEHLPGVDVRWRTRRGRPPSDRTADGRGAARDALALAKAGDLAVVLAPSTAGRIVLVAATPDGVIATSRGPPASAFSRFDRAVRAARSGPSLGAREKI